MNVQSTLILCATFFSFAATILIAVAGKDSSGTALIPALLSGLSALTAFFLSVRASKRARPAAAPDAGAPAEKTSLSALMSQINGILMDSPEEIRRTAAYPLVSRILEVKSAEELGSIISLSRDQIVKAEKILALLSDRVLTDGLILLPLADAIMKAVPVKTEEAAFSLMEKFMVVREASGRASGAARSLRAEIEDTRSEKSINFTADNTRKAVRAEREAIRDLSACTKENREHLQAMRGEIEAGLVLLNNITEITEQSKLIAFNMSIEAARMGEKGRGVKVITTELHKLNDRTFDFSRQVARLLGRFKEYNTLLVENMEQKAGVVVTHVEKGIDAAEAAVESLISATSHTEAFIREIAVMSEDINRGLDGVLESLQFQDITRQMIEGGQAVLRELKKSLDSCLTEYDIKIDEGIKNERFASIRQRFIANSKTKGEKTALMEVQL
jgi:methyl-accepting chemotaxis protein